MANQVVVDNVTAFDTPGWEKLTAEQLQTLTEIFESYPKAWRAWLLQDAVYVESAWQGENGSAFLIYTRVYEDGKTTNQAGAPVRKTEAQWLKAIQTYQQADPAFAPLKLLERIVPDEPEVSNGEV